MKESKACTQHASKHGGTQRGGRGGGGGGLSLSLFVRKGREPFSLLSSPLLKNRNCRSPKREGKRRKGGRDKCECEAEGGREGGRLSPARHRRPRHRYTGGGELGGGLAQKRVCWASSPLQWPLPTRERERGGGGGGGGGLSVVGVGSAAAAVGRAKCSLISLLPPSLVRCWHPLEEELRPRQERISSGRRRSQKLESGSRACSVGD